MIRKEKRMVHRLDLAKKLFVALMFLQMVAMTLLVLEEEPNPQKMDLRQLRGLAFEQRHLIGPTNSSKLAGKNAGEGTAKVAGENLDDDHDDWVSDEEEEEEEEEEEGETATPTEAKDTSERAADEQKERGTEDEDTEKGSEEAEKEGEEKNPEDDEEGETEEEEEEEWEANDDFSVDEEEAVRAIEARRNSKFPLAGLNCDAWGGPTRNVAKEMVYWEDIPQDAIKVSPFFKQANATTGGKPLPRQFMTFEMDSGGWNNMRMAMETMLGIALATGRTLVLPPRQRVPHFDDELKEDEKKRQTRFSFDDFFHMERIGKEYAGLNIITMQEFLEIVMKGRFVHPTTLKTLLPPNNRTNWNGASWNSIEDLNDFLRNNITNSLVRWDPDTCLAAFPQSKDPKDIRELLTLEKKLKAWQEENNYEQFVGNPVPVDGKALKRLKENSAGRRKLCIYTSELQEQDWLHFPVIHGEGRTRFLVYFYAFLFFQDWRQDLWVKRFIRDHVRYVDEIQCAAARIVQAVRRRASKRNQNGEFDTMHVRRGDFKEWYEYTMVEPPEMYAMMKGKIPENATIYIATDEKNRTFFDLLKAHYDVVFMDDFMDILGDINPNFYGNIDQLVASKGRIFYGCYSSTFTGYINRLRGYHTDAMQLKGYEKGITPSYYYIDEESLLDMQHYYPVVQPFWEREFPASWRLIDTGIDEQTKPAKGAAVA